MIRHLSLSLILSICCSAALYGSVDYVDLFSDHRAGDIGDVLTVIISESASGSNIARTTLKKKDKLGVDVSGSSWFAFLPRMGASGDINNEHKADGNAQRSNSLNGLISVQVVALEPDGRLTIEGTRTISIDGETQILSLNGTIRREDIRFDNSIYSHQIVNARITYTGQGDLRQTQRPSLVNRIFGWIF
ncbi:MAG: flagellar basal body L-ring protein FlgH [Candidatus Delongbacteria bacterium]|nr:flagellar basal body L-ring protein FlgH [Candidatus Delongbacteria bacterium]